MMPQLIAAHEVAKARFGRLDESRARLEAIRKQMDQLGKLGDLVTAEDVIKAGGHLVAAGLSPMALARLMSDMPEDGPQLAGWIGRHEAEVTRREALLQPALANSRFEMGTSALRVLMAHHFAPPGALGIEAAESRAAQRGAKGALPPTTSLVPQQTLIEPSSPAPASSMADEQR